MKRQITYTSRLWVYFLDIWLTRYLLTDWDWCLSILWRRYKRTKVSFQSFSPTHLKEPAPVTPTSHFKTPLWLSGLQLSPLSPRYRWLIGPVSPKCYQSDNWSPDWSRWRLSSHVQRHAERNGWQAQRHAASRRRLWGSSRTSSFANKNGGCSFEEIRRESWGDSWAGTALGNSELCYGCAPWWADYSFSCPSYPQ